MAERLADLAIVRKGELLCADAGQCTSDADWSRCDGKRRHPVCLGKQVHLIHAKGVERTTIAARKYGAAMETTAPDFLMLTALDYPPARGARMNAVDLALPSKDAAKIARRSKSLMTGAVRPVGELRGTFGDGVDRVIVFEPRTWPHFDPEQGAPFASEYALLVAGNTGHAVVPFLGPANRRDGLEDGVRDLDVAAVVDLDGDGTDEIVWLSQAAIAMPPSTSVSISYFADGAFHLQSLGGCSYNGCEAFKPKSRCRKGSVVPPH